MRNQHIAANPLKNCDAIPESALSTVRLLTESDKVETVILFGSRAIGDHGDRSDVDIAISAPDMTRSELAFLRDRIHTSRTLYDIAVTPLEGMPVSLRDRVLKLGVVIYERSETTR